MCSFNTRCREVTSILNQSRTHTHHCFKRHYVLPVYVKVYQLVCVSFLAFVRQSVSFLFFNAHGLLRSLGVELHAFLLHSFTLQTLMECKFMGESWNSYTLNWITFRRALYRHICWFICNMTYCPDKDGFYSLHNFLPNWVILPFQNTPPPQQVLTRPVLLFVFTAIIFQLDLFLS